MNRQDVNKFLKKLGADDELFRNFYQAAFGGSSKLYHNVVSEALVLDEGWILTIDNALHFIEEIVKHPQKFIKETQNVVPVERAKRINAGTVRHLSSHSKYLSYVAADGTLIPKKVLTTTIDEDIAIYENRFVCALIGNLSVFVEKRNREIREKMNVYDITNILMNQKFKYGDTEFGYDMRLTVKEPPKDKVLLEKNTELLEKVNNIKRRLQILTETDFYRRISQLKPVRAPILKTNIIKMNVNYNNCYKLWLYMASYTFVGFSVEVKNKDLPVDNDYFEDMTMLSAMSVKALLDDEIIRKELYAAIDFSAPAKKKYKLLKNYKYIPSFDNGDEQPKDDAVNEYFFVKMKEAFEKAAAPVKARNAVTDKKELRMSFEKFFKSVSHISNEMYKSVIGEQTGEKSLIRLSPVEAKEKDYEKQLEIYRRYRMLARLKGEDYEKALEAESREYVKLDAVKYELAELRGKEEKAEQTEKRRQKRLSAILARHEKIERKAADYENEIVIGELERREEEERLKAERKEARKRNRELKQLEFLKEKYGGETPEE
jgi:hypothetical protein